MKKCTYCGKEYPDEAVRCFIDENPLSGGESPPPVAEAIAVPPIAPPPPVPKSSAVNLTDRQMRIIEVVLVCLIAFGASIVTSTYIFFHSSYSGSRGELSWAVQILREVSCLALLWYVLKRREKSFSNLGLIWSRKDGKWSIVLYLAAAFAFYIIYRAIYLLGFGAEASVTANQTGRILFGGGVFLSTILFQFINPFFEELIVRAYLMTEIKQLTNSITKAVVISTALQASYHLYQGGPAALSQCGVFLIFSIYYAKTNRITPIILAHMYMDVGGTVGYWFRHSFSW